MNDCVGGCGERRIGSGRELGTGLWSERKLKVWKRAVCLWPALLGERVVVYHEKEMNVCVYRHDGGTFGWHASRAVNVVGVLAAISGTSENANGMNLGIVYYEATRRRRRWCFCVRATDRYLGHGLGEPSAVSVDDGDGSVVERVGELIEGRDDAGRRGLVGVHAVAVGWQVGQCCGGGEDGQRDQQRCR